MKSEIKEVKNELLNEKYYEINHFSGLKIFVMPKSGYSSSYALFGTNFGSADNAFLLDGKKVSLADGTAHFLEHKLFESEEKNAFERFAKTGARANAYTSFDRTCYLFSCSENVYENLRSLLEFVQEPYFTEQTIAKEQGIIGQEIKMYQDAPDWQATMGLLSSLYKTCAVNTDIAGTVESIAKITPEMLYSAYEAFYRADNMVLSVAGNVEPSKVLEICDECIKTSPSKQVESILSAEPDAPNVSKSVKKMPVAMPIFAFGYKEPHSGLKDVKERIETVILNQVIIGSMSPLYQSLLNEGILGEDFSSEYFTSRLYSSVIFTGVSEYPEKVKERFESEVQRVKKEGIDKELFDCIVKDMYGTIITGFNSVETIASDMLESSMSGMGLFDELEIFKTITLESLEQRLKTKYDVNSSAISIILPN